MQVSQNQQLQRHINELKAQESARAEALTQDWAGTVQELKDALQLARDQVQEREAVFQAVEEDYKQQLAAAREVQESKDVLNARIQSQ